MSESYTGPGQLIADGAEHPCHYRLEVYEDRRLKSGSGVVVSTPDALWQAVEASRCVILMEDGRSFPVIVTSYSPGNDDAPFKMAGGFIEAGA